ncbi:MAG TPA: hypothetical protein VGT44_22915, partial [Ktedonobacteraceae bacterium]|nr:hypothetical protein [Ktedonobacteraceae bacterium]
MFNLVGKRYIFLGISLLIIIPGVLSLIFKGLNVGIDFSGGTSFEFRPQSSFASIAAVQNTIKSFNFSELQVITGADTTVHGNQSVWVRLNTQVDTNVEKDITTDITGHYGANNVNVQFDDVLLNPLTGQGKATTVTVVTLAFQNVTPKIADIQSVLAHLPDTSNPALGPATSTPTPTPTTAPTTTPTATTTPKVTPTVTTTPKATPTVTTTPKATTTPTTTPTATATVTDTNPSNIKVSVEKVYQGTTTQTITLLTLTTLDQATVLKLKAALANNGNYIYVL